METIYYTVDVQNLLSIQDKETIKNDETKVRKREDFLNRKNRLLKIVLPFVHGVMILHNNKCTKSNSSTTGEDGLLGLSKRDLEKEISYYTDKDYMFSNCGGTTWINVNGTKVSIWLNDSLSSSMKVTPELGYSMTTTVIGKTYGESIENELVSIAKFCSRYKDEWKS